MYQNKAYRMFLSTALTAAVGVTAVAPIAPMSVQAGNDFSDVAPTAYYSEAVKDLANKGIIQGYSDGTFRPAQQMTRAQASKMIVKALGLSINNNAETSFSDVKMGSWYTPYVAILSEKGIITGYSDGTFKPNETVTRAQMAKMLVIAFDELEEGGNSSFTDVSAKSWYAPYVGALVEKGITTGTTKETFSPNKKVTRAHAAMFIYRINQLTPEFQKIEKITESHVTINGMDYTISEELKGILNSTNQAALKNAVVNVEIKKGKITKITNLVLTNNGAEGKLVELDANNATIKGDVQINADYISVKNLNVTGDVKISEKAKNVFYSKGLIVAGQVIISDAKVTGAMLRMSAIQSTVVTFENANLNSVDIRKSNVRVEPKGNTTMKEISVSANHANIEATEGVKIAAVTIKDGIAEAEINAAVENLSLQNSKEITVAGKGKIGTLNLLGAGLVNLNTTGKIGNLIVAEGKKPADLIKNFEQVKSNIEKIGGITPPPTPPPVTPPVGGGGGGGGGSTGSNALATAKSSAISELESYKDSANYRAEERTALATAIQNGKTAINAATKTEAVTTALAAAKVVIDGIKTDAQLTEEERVVATAKTTAITELEGYVVSTNYRTAEQATLTEAIENGKTTINAATTTEAVTTALAAAKAEIDGIKTDSLMIVELAIEKLPETITLEDETAVLQVKSDYDRLISTQKALVSADLKTKLNTTLEKLNQEIFSYDVGENVTITGYKGKATDIVIPSMLGGKTVTSIGNDAFYEKGLTTVTIPESVTSIGEYAFADNNLQSVTIPGSVESIGHSAFNANNLKNVTIPGSVESIGRWAFESNELETVVIEKGVESIGGGAFSTNQLTSVTIPESVTSIEDYAFEYNNLTTVTIPGSVTIIGSGAFYDNNLTTVTIPGSVTSIGDYAFDSNALETVEIQEGVTSIDSGAFFGNQLKTVTIPGSVTSIGGDAFANNQLTTVTIPGSVKSIGDYAFYSNKLETVIIQEGITTIGNGALANNPGLNSITIGTGVTIRENLTGNNNFRNAYTSGSAGTYHKLTDQVEGETWIKDDLQAPTIVKVTKYPSGGGYNRVEIKFSEPILDSSVDTNSFRIRYTNTVDSQSEDGNITSFSTSWDGTTNTNETNDEYIYLSFNEKDTVDSVTYTKDAPIVGEGGSSSVAKNLTDLTGDLLETRTITQIDTMVE